MNRVVPGLGCAREDVGVAVLAPAAEGIDAALGGLGVVALRQCTIALDALCGAGLASLIPGRDQCVFCEGIERCRGVGIVGLTEAIGAGIRSGNALIGVTCIDGAVEFAVEVEFEHGRKG